MSQTPTTRQARTVGVDLQETEENRALVVGPPLGRARVRRVRRLPGPADGELDPGAAGEGDLL